MRDSVYFITEEEYNIMT